MPSQPSTLAWNILAALLLTISVTLVTDFTRRLLGADPDSLGILAIAVQAVLALIASSTFTQAGSVWLDAALGHVPAYGTKKEQWRCGMAAGLFVLTGLFWLAVPDRLADHYNTRGYNARHSGDPSGALRDYDRAIALNPQHKLAYLNLGVLYEEFYRYEDAAEAYRKAIVADRTDATPYNNLARVLLLDGKSLAALRIANDGLHLNPPDAADIAALRKNRAWAEYELGFYPQAIADATAADSAPGDCILGMTYAKLSQPAAAQIAWARFNQRLSATNPPPSVEPDCRLLAGGTL